MSYMALGIEILLFPGHTALGPLMNSKKRCKSCREYFPFEDMQMYPIGAVCGSECLTTLINEGYEKNRLAAAKQAQKIINKQVRIDNKVHAERKKKFNDNDLKWQHKVTQSSFNKLRKLQEIIWFEDRGLEPECISCGKTNMDWCCGHLKTVGSSGSLRYSENNTKLQCNRYCNMGLSGNINGNKTTRGYLQGLIDRFGSVEAKRITDSLTDEVKKWTCVELIIMRKEFNVEIRRLEAL